MCVLLPHILHKYNITLSDKWFRNWRLSDVISGIGMTSGRRVNSQYLYLCQKCVCVYKSYYVRYVLYVKVCLFLYVGTPTCCELLLTTLFTPWINCTGKSSLMNMKEYTNCLQRKTKLVTGNGTKKHQWHKKTLWLLYYLPIVN